MWLRFKKKTQIVRVTFGTEFHLHYELLPTPAARRWLKLLMAADGKSHIEDGGVFYGPRFYSAAELVAGFNAAIATINFYGLHKIENKIHPDLSQDELNDLHAWFEKLCDLPEYRVEICGAEVYRAVRDLNTLVHRFENLKEKTELHNVVVPFLPRIATPLTKEDYRHFSLDSKAGHMYLSYARVGVPFLNAFDYNTDTPPVAQEEMTPNVLLRFGSSRIFSQHAELAKWLKERHGRDIADPSLALGAIPVAKLVCEPADVIEQIKSHRHVAKIEAVEELPAASWPSLPEVFTQLDLVPFIDLNLRFDHKTCLEEAMALLPRFVSHRGYDVGDGWKSLALVAQNGDERKTDHYANYSKKERRYKLTKAAADCPHIMSFLNHVTDLAKCKRVRLMLLEPGAKIAVHRDGKDVHSGLAVNIALNMPAGCTFTMDSRSDGSHTLYTRPIPFTDGSVMLINNSKYHYLENNSPTPRIHIIVHGPLRMGEKELLRLARAQNKIASEAEAIHQLILKRARLNEDLRPSDKLYYDWVSHGFGLKSHVKVGILDDGTSGDAAEKITGASLFPMEYERITAGEIAQRPDLIPVPAGTFVEDPYMFAFQAIRDRHSQSFPQPNLEKAKEAADNLLKNAREHVYHFNNEPMKQTAPFGFAPTKLISVASGLKLFTTVRDLFPEGKVPVVLVDQSAPALKYLGRLCRARSLQEFLSVIAEDMQRQQIQNPKFVASEKLKSFLNEEFEGNFANLAKILNQIEVAAAIKADLLTKADKLLEHVQPGDHIYFWHSNVWRANWSYFRFTKEELKENYKRFVEKLADKLGESFSIRDSHLFEAVIGNSICSEHLTQYSNQSKFKQPTISEGDGPEIFITS